MRFAVNNVPQPIKPLLPAMDEKGGLPPYSAAPAPACHNHRPRPRMRRTRVVRYAAVACLVFIVWAQWTYLWRTTTKLPRLSIDKLNADLDTCKKLRTKPKDPIGLGRDKNARYIDGAKPTLIKNATIWVGEPSEGTNVEDARAGVGWDWIEGDVFLEHGLIKKVESKISERDLPKDTIIYDVKSRPLTAGIIDMHSHAGVYSLPELKGNADGNEYSDNITPWARSIDGLMPLDPQIQVIKSGGVTTSLVLPGSANNIGGEAFVVKHAVGEPDGRTEISAADMLADPDRNWRYMKMACGENPKNVHGSRTTRPSSRMGESFEFRHAFEQTRALIQKQDDWCAKAESVGIESMDEYLPQELEWEALVAALRGQVHINTHCYTIPDLEAMVDHTNEFEFPVRAFHHAHQTFLVPEILKRTWGGRPPSSAIFADNMYYKVEAYIGSEFAGKYLYEEGLTPIYVSDNPVLSAQHVLFEAAKGYHYGLPYHAALASVTTAPADDLGLGQRLGKIKPGFDADVVVWDSDPLSIGAAPAQVWIDGTAQYDDPFVLDKPYTGPVVPNKALGNVVEKPIELTNVTFTGITNDLLGRGEDGDLAATGEPFNVVVWDGKVCCVGSCDVLVKKHAESGHPTIHLENGHLYNPFVGVGGTLGLNEIDSESLTDNGANPGAFSRAVDGLMLDSKKLRAAFNAGVTRVISAPKFSGGDTHHGTSVGFVTKALTSVEDGAIFADDIAVHYTYTHDVKMVMGSMSAAFGVLRSKLMSLKDINPDGFLLYSEDLFLMQVLKGTRTLALTINSADGIAAALRVKKDVEKFYGGQGLKVAIIGGAEAHLVADKLAEAKVGVILSPLLNEGDSWDARRSLTGAPLTNGTNIDKLLDAGVKVGIGLHEDWEVRDLSFSAGIAYRNSEGRLSMKQAVDLVSNNIYEILGVEVPSSVASGHWVVSEGSPLEIGSRIKGIGFGNGKMALFHEDQI